MLDIKIGITIGYFLDLVGFLILFFTGTFDINFKKSLDVIEKLKVEVDIQEKILKGISEVRSQTVATDLITGAPLIGSGFIDMTSLAPLSQELKLKKNEMISREQSHNEKFKYYLVFNRISPKVGVIMVIVGIFFQWYYSII